MLEKNGMGGASGWQGAASPVPYNFPLVSAASPVGRMTMLCAFSCFRFLWGEFNVYFKISGKLRANILLSWTSTTYL